MSKTASVFAKVCTLYSQSSFLKDGAKIIADLPDGTEFFVYALPEYKDSQIIFSQSFFIDADRKMAAEPAIRGVDGEVIEDDNVEFSQYFQRNKDLFEKIK